MQPKTKTQGLIPKTENVNKVFVLKNLKFCKNRKGKKKFSPIFLFFSRQIENGKQGENMAYEKAFV